MVCEWYIRVCAWLVKRSVFVVFWGVFSRSGALKAANLQQCMGTSEGGPIQPGVGVLYYIVMRV